MKQARCIVSIDCKDIFYEAGSFKYFIFYKAFIKAELGNRFLRAACMRESKTKEWLRQVRRTLGPAFCSSADVCLLTSVGTRWRFLLSELHIHIFYTF